MAARWAPMPARWSAGVGAGSVTTCLVGMGRSPANNQVSLLAPPGSSLVVTVVRQGCAVLGLGSLDEAWFGLDSTSTQHVGPPHAMIASSDYVESYIIGFMPTTRLC